ncbi:MAG: hypothetical protein JO061_21855 [Acidobacteriaceae bacterium]|nr:hypothetical protein [Acidobacteriaceae bacterium]
MFGKPRQPARPLKACAVAFAIPLTREQFLSDFESVKKDFVRNYASEEPLETAWRYYQSTAAFARELVAELTAGGAVVNTSATIDQWSNLVRQRHVVTLFAHWTNRNGVDEFEFAEGLRSLDDLIACLPDAYSGVLDFIVCRSTKALDRVKQARPKSTVIANRNEADLSVRLAMFRQIMKLVSAGRDYVDAAMTVHKAMLGLKVK